MSPPTVEQKKAAIKMVMAIADAIKELKTVPEGVLYANIMGNLGQDPLPAFQALIAILVDGGLVKRENNVLIWKG